MSSDVNPHASRAAVAMIPSMILYRYSWRRWRREWVSNIHDYSHNHSHGYVHESLSLVRRLGTARRPPARI